MEEEEGEGQCGEAKGPQGRRHQFFFKGSVTTFVDL